MKRKSRVGPNPLERLIVRPHNHLYPLERCTITASSMPTDKVWRRTMCAPICGTALQQSIRRVSNRGGQQTVEIKSQVACFPSRLQKPSGSRNSVKRQTIQTASLIDLPGYNQSG